MPSKETVIHLLQNPRKVADHPEDDLRQLAEAYPYSQPLQLLYAARLRYSNEHLFQRQLGRTALITNDRSVLFELFEEEAPLQEQAQQVSESHEWDEVSPEEWDLASRPKEPAPEDEAASSDYSATPPPEPAPTAEAAAGETDLEAQAETAASPPAGEQPGENAEKTTPPKTGPIDTSPEPDKAEEADHAATASKASVPDGSSPAEEKAEPSPTSVKMPPERPARPTARESGEQLQPDSMSERMKAILERSRQLRQRQRQEAEDKLTRARDQAPASEKDPDEAAGPSELSAEKPPTQENVSPPAAPYAQGEQKASEPAQETSPKEPGQPVESSTLTEDPGPPPENPAEKDSEALGLEEQAQLEEHQAPAEEEPTLTTSETVDDGQPERQPKTASSDPEEDTIDQKLRSIRQRLEQIQDDGPPEAEPESLEGTALQEEAEATIGALLTTGELSPEAETEPEEDPGPGPAAPDQPSESMPSEGTAAEAETKTPEGESGGEEESLDQEFLEIEALIDQYRQEEVPRLVDEASASEEVEQADEEQNAFATQETAPAESSAEETTSETKSQPHSFIYWLKRLSGKAAKMAPEPEEGAAPSHPEEKPSTPASPETTGESAQTDTSANTAPAEKEDADMSMEDKLQLLDSFVEKLPELKKKKPGGPPPPEDKPAPNRPLKAPNRQKEEDGALVTETLAKVYIRQKHYKKAIQAYEILKLKYPEKSSFFASQISEIKELINSK